KFAAYGEDLSSLALAEALVNSGWLTTDSTAEAVHGQIVATCREANLSPPVLLTTERTAQVRAILKHLAMRWGGLIPKGTIRLAFDPSNPAQSFDQLLRTEASGATI